MEVFVDFRASQSLALEGIRNEILRHIQTSRKQADLQVTDKVTAYLTSQDEYILASARLNADYIKQECQLTSLEVAHGENVLTMQETEYPYSSTKWHSPVGLKDGELYFGRGEMYAHYWEALDAWASKVNRG